MTGRDGRLPGVILAGGAGRRWGGPKQHAVLPDGAGFLDRARRALAPACAPIRIGGVREAIAGLDPLPDLRDGVGPAAGIEAALARAEAEGAPGVVVLAVDLPRMSAGGVLALLERWRSCEDPARSVVIGAGAEGVQPLAGVWGVAALPAVRAALDRGVRRVRDLLDPALAGRVVEVPEATLSVACGHPRPLLNVNGPDDGRAAVTDPVCPPIVAVSGWKNSGKTTVAAALVDALTSEGLRVMALKRGHGFDLDREGTDSHRLTAAGAARTVLAGPDTRVVLGAAAPALGDGAAALAAAWLADADVVIAEGWKSDPLPLIEVRRASAAEHRPISPGPAVDRRLALVSDRPGDLASEGALPMDDPGTTSTLVELVRDRILARAPDPERVP